MSWNTIESDAGVFTELIEKLGVKGVEFEELLSIDEDSINQVQPLYGAIFLFKYRSSQYSQPQHADFSQDPTVFFAQQRIQNACATQAVLSILLNRPDLETGDILNEFKSFTEAFDPELRGEAISNSDSIRQVHNSFSRPNPFIDEDDDKKPKDEENDGLYHFIAYVPVNGRLVELDGLRANAIDHGECGESFAKKLSEVITNRVANDPAGEMRFNLIALTKDKRELYREMGDTESLAVEERKRAEWQRENALRRENFVGLIYDLVKGVASKMTDDEFQQSITKGREATKEKIRQRQQ